jgi:D-methionine transport system ATP-binding protein
VIRIHGLRKVFKEANQTVVAVDGVDLEIREGEIFGVIGYSGAGKSTLIRMINMLERPTSGSVVVGGREMTRLNKASLRKARQEIGMIFQHFNLLWSRTVRENVAFPLEVAGWPTDRIGPRVEELLHLVGLSERADAYPSQLSGGQTQRVGIARALANYPKVLLSDEATSALDPQTTDSILELLARINREMGLTIVLITHEMHVIRKICHRVAVMERGKLVETGPVEEVFRNPKQPFTRQFVQQLAQAPFTGEVPYPYPDGGEVWRCFLSGSVGHATVIPQLIRDFALAVAFLRSHVQPLEERLYGTVDLHVQGEKAEREKARQFLLAHDVKVEVLRQDV